MMITSPAQALAALDDNREHADVREMAVRYLADYPTPAVLARLSQALQDDDVGVRWEAATVLTQQGEPGLLEVLKALTDPKRVGDPRLREGAYHILHSSQATAPVPIAELLDALRGPAADIASLVEADRVLRTLEKQRSVKAQAAAKSDATDTTPTNNLSPKYGPAQLTGRLGRLGGHRFD
jgi:HEAT repeat protein